MSWRAVTSTGRPVIAQMHQADLGGEAQVKGGVFVATAHGPWEVGLGLGMGCVVSEMVLGRTTSVDVEALGAWKAQNV